MDAARTGAALTDGLLAAPYPRPSGPLRWQGWLTDTPIEYNCCVPNLTETIVRPPDHELCLDDAALEEGLRPEELLYCAGAMIRHRGGWMECADDDECVAPAIAHEFQLRCEDPSCCSW